MTYQLAGALILEPAPTPRPCFTRIAARRRRQHQAGGWIHVTQLRRCEAGTAQPTLDVLRRIALALRIFTDFLVFDDEEVGPDEELRLQFEALKKLDPEEKRVVRSVLESILIKHDAKRWMTAG